MMTVSNITLHLPPATTAEIEAAYVRLALGVAEHVPNLLHSYRGPASWLTAIRAEPPALPALRQQAIELATSLQQSHLPRQRRDWLLRQSRALLWLIRAWEQEQIMFSEQVRLLLDVPPESAGEAVFQMAHQALDVMLPGSGGLAERWATWQTRHTCSATQALPLLRQAMNTLAELLDSGSPLRGVGLPTLAIDPMRDTVGYQPQRFYLPAAGILRVDRLYHLAAQAIAWHSLATAAAQRSSQGEVACTVWLNRGPEQIIRQGLPQAIMAGVDVYQTALPGLLIEADLPVLTSDDLRAIHLAEDALAWAVADAALLLHGEGLRPRALRRHLMAHALFSQAEAERCLTRLAQPIEAAHVFAPLIGGPLLTAWLGQRKHSLTDLLTDPPVPSRMLFDVQSDTRRHHVHL